MDRELYLKILKAIPMFQKLLPEELAMIVGMSRLLRVRPGVAVVQEGDEGASMYVMVSGAAKVTRRLRNGQTAHLSDLAAPSVFGEMALIDRFRRSATVTTTAETVLFQLDLIAFNALRSSYHPAAFKVLREVAPMLCKRLRDVNDKIGRYLVQPSDILREDDSVMVVLKQREPNPGVRQ